MKEGRKEGSKEGEKELRNEGREETAKKEKGKRKRKGKEGPVSMVLASSGHHQEYLPKFPELIIEFATSK